MFKPRHESKAISLQAIARVMFKPFLFSLIQGDLPLLFGVSRVCSSPFINPKQKKRSPSYQSKELCSSFFFRESPNSTATKKKKRKMQFLKLTSTLSQKARREVQKSKQRFFFLPPFTPKCEPAGLAKLSRVHLAKTRVKIPLP